MMGPGAAKKVENCLEIIKEVKGWDLQKGAKAFLDAAKAHSLAEKKAMERIADADKADKAVDKRSTSLTRRETVLKNDRKAFKAEQDEWAKVVASDNETLERRRTALSVATAAVKDRERRAADRDTMASGKLEQAQAVLKKAEDLEKSLKPKLDLIDKLRA